MNPDTPPPEALRTIGHSTLPVEQLLGALRTCGARTLADVRRMPASRHNPQYNREPLAAAVAAAGLRYIHLPALGGLRRPAPDSANTGWASRSFRGYADYMATPAFAAALDELLALHRESGPAAILCAESVPWRCHRSLIADAVMARGLPVWHILVGRDGATAQPHVLTAFAQVDQGRVRYPGPPEQLRLL